MVRWVDLGCLPDFHPIVLSLGLFNRSGEEKKMKNLVGQDKEREITYQFLSRAKQTQLEEN